MKYRTAQDDAPTLGGAIALHVKMDGILPTLVKSFYFFLFCLQTVPMTNKTHQGPD